MAKVKKWLIKSGVSHQPLSDDQAIAGATNRARLALESAVAKLGIGVEGNTVETALGSLLSLAPHTSPFIYNSPWTKPRAA
jgi:non-canonical (house-cleaning) NTP pyrophosphatase